MRRVFGHVFYDCQHLFLQSFRLCRLRQLSPAGPFAPCTSAGPFCIFDHPVHLHGVRDRSGTGQGQVRDRSGTGQGQVRDRSGTGQGQVRDRSGTGQGQVRDRTGTSRGLVRDWSGSCSEVRTSQGQFRDWSGMSTDRRTGLKGRARPGERQSQG